MRLPLPKSTRTTTPYPDTTLFRSVSGDVEGRGGPVDGEGLGGVALAVGVDRHLEGEAEHDAGQRHEQGRERRPVADGLGGAGLGQLARSEEHTSELQSLMRISYAVFCFKKNNIPKLPNTAQS